MKTDSKKAKFYDEMRSSLLQRKPETMEIEFRKVSKNNRRDLHGVMLP